jgi:hypothetical protein
MIDNIITNTLLPALSREFLNRSLAKEELTEARVTVKDGAFAYEWRSATDPELPPLTAHQIAPAPDEAPDEEAARSEDAVFAGPLGGDMPPSQTEEIRSTEPTPA